MKIRRILVPTDFSASSDKAADHAAALARDLGGSLVVVFVEGIFTYGLSGDLMGSTAAIQFFEEHRRDATARLERLRERLAKTGVPVRAVFTQGVPWQAIGDVARRVRADLIVMATHGRTGMSHVFMGSVAEKVVRTAPCPVLTIRPPESAGIRRKAAA